MPLRVVTSSYKDEELLDTWIPRLKEKQIDYYIYYKKDTLKKGEEEQISSNTFYIPNYGRCDYAFLYHIIKNYDNLDDTTLFVKNNWKSQDIDIWDHIDKCTKYDFMESGTLRRFQYWNKNKGKYPRHEEIYKASHIFAETQLKWYHEIFSGIQVPHVIPGWGHGPCFSVSKRLIHRHPKSVYEHLLNKFHPESGSWDIEKASQYIPDFNKQIEEIGKHYHDCLQRFWYVLFTHNIDTNTYKCFKP